MRASSTIGIYRAAPAAFFLVSRQNFISRIAVLKWPIFLFFKKGQYSFTSPFSNSLRKKAAREVVSFS